MARSRVFTGARARLFIKGKPVGYATGTDSPETIEYFELEVLDDIRVKEHVPVRYRTSFTAALVRLVEQDLKAAGIFPKTGNNSDEHLNNILNQEDLTIAIQDVPTGRLLATLTECKASANRWSVQAGTVSTTNVEFMAIAQLSESEL